MTDGMREPIMDGLRAEHPRARRQRPEHDGRGAVPSTIPTNAIPIAGKTGTAQGPGSYPWNDSSVFAAFSLDDAAAVHRRVLPREVRVRLRGAAPVVKCMYLALSGITPLDPVNVSEPLDLDSTEPAPPAAPVDTVHAWRTTGAAREPDRCD